MQTVLVTGANGFVGYYLCGLLLEKGYKVVATGKGLNRLPFQHNAFCYQSLDFTDKTAVTNVFETFVPDVVVHSGAMSKPDECELQREKAYMVNVAGTQNLLEAAGALKAYFLFISTDFVFEGANLQYKEDDQPAPQNYYGETKLMAEAEVRKYAYGWSIVRTILVYGHPGSGRQNLLTIVANGLKTGKPLRIVADQTRMPTYVEDLTAALAALIDKRLEGIYHISGKDVLTPYAMACAVADYLGFKHDLIEKVSGAVFKEPAKRPPVTGFDLTKAKDKLGYQPLSYAEGLKKTLAE